jgi:hypothetical protein
MKVNAFDLDEVCTFLTAIGLGDKVGSFRENGIDGDMFTTLTVEDFMSELGLTSLQAKKIVRSIEAEMSRSSSSAAPSEATLERVKALEAQNASLKRQVAAAQADVNAAQASQQAAMNAAHHHAPPPRAGK